MSDLQIPYPLLFPWDVIYHIVDTLGSDVRVLLRLALVCSNLLPRCRRHLFWAIRFEPTQDDINALCSFLEANPQLPPRVRQVSVYPTCDLSRRRQVTGSIFPFQLIRMIPHLSRWKFCGGFYDDLRRLVFHPKTLAYMRTTVIQHLELSFVVFISQAEMLRFLSSFPLLRSLRFSLECFQTPLNRRLVDPVTRHGSWPQLRLRSLSVCTSNQCRPFCVNLIKD
ncbi:hypothetical protein LXA43DRAFT_885053 [Ganoderma leucocontextum]|nr:hypothetical protein LXA43DRAFT_885053 [Ganoderma leucocontextum]